MPNSKTDVYNQIAILKTFHINNQVAQKLNWRTSWFKKDQLNWAKLGEQKDLLDWKPYYKNDPFEVTETPGAFNSPGIELYIKPVSTEEYELTVEGEAIYEGKKKDIHISALCKYNEPLVNDYFNFTISPTNGEHKDLDKIFYFVFNESAQVANNYRKRLTVDLNDQQSEIVLIQLIGKQPEREIDYLNELISVYLQNAMSFQTETHKRSLLFIDSQLVGISDSLGTTACDQSVSHQ